MAYEKGRLSRQQIIEAVDGVIREKGYARTSVADLAGAAGITLGKLTHHFPTRVAVFEAVFEYITNEYRAGPMSLLANTAIAPLKRVDAFFTAMYKFYASKPIGCPVGHAVSDVDSVSDTMRDRAAALLAETEQLFRRIFVELGHSPKMVSTLASLTINAWQGAVFMARREGGLEHLEEAFDSLRTLAKSDVSDTQERRRR